MREKNILKLINKYRSAIMGVAALWVMFFHAWVPIFVSNKYTYFIECFIKRKGYIGVDIFFFLSGMGMVYAIQKYDVLTFYKRKLVRVFLPYFFIGALQAIYYKLRFVDFLKNVFGISFYTKEIYTFLWFGIAILTVYFLFPIYYFLLSKCRNPYIFTFISLLLWFIISHNGEHIIRWDFYNFTNRLPIIMIGILVGWHSQKKKIEMNGISWLACWLLFILGIVLCYVTNDMNIYVLVPSSYCFLPSMLIAIPGVMLLAKTLEIFELGTKHIGAGVAKVLAFLGSLSWELYCVQEFLWREFTYGMAEKIGNMGENIVFFAITILGAVILQFICRKIQKVFKV